MRNNNHNNNGKNGKVAILTLGDNVDFDSYKKANVERQSFEKEGFNYITAHYKNILNGKTPKIIEDKIIVFLFFPFKYWNKNIEHKNYRGVYANSTFYKKFNAFWKRVEKNLKRKYPKKEIYFINSPKECSTYRDKLTVGKKLTKSQINHPKQYTFKNTQSLIKKLTQGKKFFLKPRFGSMGKGITFVSQDNWQTNFGFKNNRIISRKSDYGWEFKDITGNKKFLGKILEHDLIIEEGKDQYLYKGDMVDLRIYTFLKKVIYVYPRRNDPHNVTTNISQGGRGAPKLLKHLPGDLIKKAIKESERVSEVLNIHMAGIDVIIDRNSKDVFIIDVNVFPGFPKRKTFNLARYMAKKLKKVSLNGTFFVNGNNGHHSRNGKAKSTSTASKNGKSRR